jgi:hypothetical protein
MTREEFRKLQEAEATFPSVAAGGWPWRKLVPPKAAKLKQPRKSTKPRKPSARVKKSPAV